VRPETEAKIRAVQKFARYARSISAFFGGMSLLLMAVMWARILTGPTGSGFKVGLGAFDIAGDQLTTASIKAWALFVVTIAIGVTGWALYHLYRLFDRLAAGSIYAKETVWHLRQVGLLSMAMAVLQIILPLLSVALAEFGVIDRALLTPVDSDGKGNTLLFGPLSLGGFIPAALILLASWILDVGREVSEDAEAMRREADLVI
jgi:hypothetical protein